MTCAPPAAAAMRSCVTCGTPLDSDLPLLLMGYRFVLFLLVLSTL